LSNRYFTVMVVPDRDSRVRSWRVSKRRVVQGAVALGILFVLSVAAALHYASVFERIGENRLLAEENAQLREQLRVVEEKVAHIGETLDRVERFDQRLRALTSLNDPERNLAIGPLASSGADDPGLQVGFGGPAPAEDLVDRLDKLVQDAADDERSLSELHRYFEDQRSLLASTPSVWPARGWVTSDFGTRLDPYTASRVMHKGLDIANSAGTPIVAPADGTVVFAGTEGGYGRVLVLDHGFGVKTRYGHLSEIKVKLGEKVKRGQNIAAMGNTGRSTGPHLHYEVRVNGIPENPRKFILE
jgi:murein DD-endopeptidase MepM/ murein hydrolase activator NlpD